MWPMAAVHWFSEIDIFGSCFFRETVERPALLEPPEPLDPLVPLDPLDPLESLVTVEIP